MAKRRKANNQAVDRRTGGVYIDGGSHVTVGGDLVGGNKVTLGRDDKQFEALFVHLKEVIQSDKALNTADKEQVLAESEKLKEELEKSEPDLGAVARLKRFISSKGGVIAAAVGAIFQYPPVQEAIKVVSQRLMGG